MLLCAGLIKLISILGLLLPKSNRLVCNKTSQPLGGRRRRLLVFFSSIHSVMYPSKVPSAAQLLQTVNNWAAVGDTHLRRAYQQRVTEMSWFNKINLCNMLSRASIFISLYALFIERLVNVQWFVLISTAWYGYKQCTTIAYDYERSKQVPVKR